MLSQLRFQEPLIQCKLDERVPRQAMGQQSEPDEGEPNEGEPNMGELNKNEPNNCASHYVLPPPIEMQVC
jgi:hypothetical protein